MADYLDNVYYLYNKYKIREKYELLILEEIICNHHLYNGNPYSFFDKLLTIINKKYNKNYTYCDLLEN